MPGGVRRHVGQHEVCLARRAAPPAAPAWRDRRSRLAGTWRPAADRPAAGRATTSAGAARDRDLAPAAGRRAEIDHARATPQQMESLIQLDQLERRARPPALRLRCGHIRIVQLPRQPPLRGGAAAARRGEPDGWTAHTGPPTGAWPRKRRRRAGAPARGRCARIMRNSMPSRSPRSATTISGAGQIRWMAAKIAQPGSTNSARSAPTQGCCASPSRPSARSRASAASAVVAGQHRAIDGRPAVARQLQHHARQRGDGAGSAEQAHAALPDFVADAMHGSNGAQPFRHVLGHGVEALAGQPGGRRTARPASPRPPAATRSRSAPAARRSAAARTQASSVDPPPMSNSSARLPPLRSSGAQLSSASSASSRLEITSICSPVSALHAGEELGPVAGAAAGFGGDRPQPRTGRRASRPRIRAAPGWCGPSPAG